MHSIRTVVVLPAPLGPRKPNTSPADTVRSMSRTASIPPLKSRRSDRAAIAVSPVLATAAVLLSGSKLVVSSMISGDVKLEHGQSLSSLDLTARENSSDPTDRSRRITILGPRWTRTRCRPASRSSQWLSEATGSGRGRSRDGVAVHRARRVIHVGPRGGRRDSARTAARGRSGVETVITSHEGPDRQAARRQADGHVRQRRRGRRRRGRRPGGCPSHIEVDGYTPRMRAGIHWGRSVTRT